MSGNHFQAVKKRAIPIFCIVGIGLLMTKIFFTSDDEEVEALSPSVADRQLKKSQVSKAIEQLQIKDKNLFQCVVNASLERARLAPSDSDYRETLIPLKNLYCRRKNITSLSGLEHFVHLKFLDVSRNHIRDISPLENLHSLEKLYLSQNKIDDLNPLVGLKSLEILNIQGNPVQDISALKNLPNLRNVVLPELSDLACEDIKSIIGTATANMSETLCTDKSVGQKKNQTQEAEAEAENSYTLTEEEENEIMDFQYDLRRNFD